MTDTSRRVVALDWMRGFVMVLMVLDHTSLFFNSGRVADDTVATYVAGSALPLDQFLLRWVTHLCAPTFLFLAGAGLSLGAEKRLKAGHGDAAIRRDLLIRGALIVALDLVYMSSLAQHLMLQVLYAIGLSMIVMALLRRLPDRALLALALGWFVAGEWLTDLVWDPPANSSVAAALTVARYTEGSVWIFYPVIPWLAMMMLGWVYGRHLGSRGNDAAMRTAALWGAAGLGVFVVIRAAGGYGNMWLQREDDSLQHWLHVSKYPPSLSYAALELGLMGLCIAALFWLQKRVTIHARGPVLVFGQTSLFFYLAHFTLIGVGGGMLGVDKAGIPRALTATAVVLVVLYPLCLWFRGFKRARPRSWVRFI